MLELHIALNVSTS